MQIDFLTSNRLESGTLIAQILKECSTLYEWKAFKQYYPKEHNVLDKVKRKDKVIQIPIPNAEANANGEVPTQSKVVELNRIPLALQQLIVSRKTAFVTGGNVSLKAKPQTEAEKNLYDDVLKVWRNNKLQFKNADIFKRMVSETECAEIWYSKVNEDQSINLKVNIFSPSKGYNLYPVFDAHEDLIAFGLGYKETIENKEVEYFDVYDSEFITRHIKESGGIWKLRQTEGVANPLPNPYGKIPVIYYQSKTAWSNVQWLIERLETLLSNFGDVNDYNGSPILFAEGDIHGFSDKGESGKVIQGENGAKLSYVSWDHAPESIKLEIETLLDFIYTLTQTPNISFKEMKGLGGLSGVAFDRVFLDAHLNAKDYHTGEYGEGIQRRVNFLKTALKEIETGYEDAADMEITPEFGIFSIDSDSDRIETAMKANGNLPVMSHKDSITYTGLSDEPEVTLNEIKAQTPNTVTT